MVAPIEAGGTTPPLDTELLDAEGNPHVIAQAVVAGPAVVLAVYKSSCQASKTFFPFLERLHERSRDHGLTTLGVSQDSANITRSFARRYGITFPFLIEPDGYPVSTALDIFATPTVYLIRPDGTVAYTTMGFFKGPVNEFGNAAAAELGLPPEELFTAEDVGIPVFVPG